MKIMAIIVELLVLSSLSSGCVQKREIAGADACRNNGGVHKEFSAIGGGPRVLWLCRDGSVRWSDKNE